uniref:U-box domain-containing protein n=1 Tax=Arundo donax TaxID=35708 RepID=A0A0A9BAX8_ARUDO
MIKEASSPLSQSSRSIFSGSSRAIGTPSYFLCPISQGVMRDPQVAADGFTYEADALRDWFDSGHDTSPVTNIALSNCDTVPNHALRLAIQEYLQQN